LPTTSINGKETSFLSIAKRLSESFDSDTLITFIIYLRSGLFFAVPRHLESTNHTVRKRGMKAISQLLNV